jgi:hypothetical protein
VPTTSVSEPIVSEGPAAGIASAPRGRMSRDGAGSIELIPPDSAEEEP